MVIIIGFKQKTSIQETASIACKVTVTICSVEAQNKENNNILSCVMNWFIKTIGTRVQFSFFWRELLSTWVAVMQASVMDIHVQLFLWTLNIAVMMHRKHHLPCFAPTLPCSHSSTQFLGKLTTWYFGEANSGWLCVLKFQVQWDVWRCHVREIT